MGIRLEPEEIEKLWQGYERDDPFQETDWDAIVALAAQKKLLDWMRCEAMKHQGTILCDALERVADYTEAEIEKEVSDDTRT